MAGKKKKQRATAVEWSWRGDQDNWVAFDKNVCAMFEEAFQAGKKKVRVDKERYLDLSLSNAEVLKNFTKLDSEDDVVGMQRRYDDEMKRRAVKRVVPDFFEKDTLLLLSKKKNKLEEFIPEVELYSGVTTKKYMKTVTAVVCDEEEVESFEDELQQAHDAKVPIVTFDFIVDSIESGKRLGTDDYEIDFKPKKKEKKRKKESSDEENDQKKKKGKHEVPDQQEMKCEAKDTSQDKIEEDEEVQTFADAPALKKNTQWMGTSTMEADGATYPVVMQVNDRKGNNFSGEITGEDDVEIPAKYVGKYNPQEPSISGKLETDDEEAACHYVLKKIAAPPLKDFDVLKKGATFSGVAWEPFEFKLEITTRKGNKIEGTVTWPALGASTKLRGTIEGDEVEFEEFETTKDSVIVPTNYIGRLIKGHLRGIFSNAESKGKFDIDTSK